jgi:hypothetical protein
MRNNLLLSLVAVSVVASSAARADVYINVNERGGSEYGPNLLLINPGDLINGVISLEYERALSPWFGLTIGASVWAFRGWTFGQNDTYFAFLPELGARFHFIRDAPGGLFIGPTVSAGYVASSSGTLTSAFAWGLGASVGYNFIIGRNFTFQLGVGGRFTDYGGNLVWSPRLLLGLGATF